VARRVEADANARPNCVDCKARSFALYARAGTRDPHGIERLRRDVRRLKAKRIIHRERETPDAVYTLFEGWAFRFRLLDDGRRQILSFLLPGSAIGLPLHGSSRMKYSVQALTDVTLCAFGRAELADYLGSVGNGLSSLETCYASLCEASDERLVDLGRRTARERLGSLILDLRERLAAQGKVANETMFFPLKRQHIADTLGLTPVHVGRVLGQLVADKIISLDRDSLTVLDLPALADLSR
jgi:CRP/FNR family transcriptional regulator, anaerobic regulatory protein